MIYKRSHSIVALKQLKKLCRSSKVVIVSILLFCLAGCASTIGTHINAFSLANSSLQQGSTIAVLPGGSIQAQSLEFQLYKGKVSQALSTRGYQVVEPKTADHILYLSYEVNRIENDDSDLRTGYIINSHTRRSGLGANFLLFSNDRDRPNFLRKLSFKIDKHVDDQAAQRLYEMTASSEGRCSVMSEVFDEMLEAIMKGFPSGDGKLYYVKVKSDTNCQY